MDRRTFILSSAALCAAGPAVAFKAYAPGLVDKELAATNNIQCGVGHSGKARIATDKFELKRRLSCAYNKRAAEPADTNRHLHTELDSHLWRGFGTSAGNYLCLAVGPDSDLGAALALINDYSTRTIAEVNRISD